MKKIPFSVCIATLLAVSLAHAQPDEITAPNPIGLGWNGCSTAKPVGDGNVSFACENEPTNACRVFRLLPTFVSSIDSYQFAGSVTYIDVHIGTGPTIGEWWTVGTNPGTCRGGQLLYTVGAITAPSLPNPGACHNLYPVSAANLPGQVPHATGVANRIRLYSANSVYPPQSLTRGQRTYAMQLELRTEGTLADCDPIVDPTPLCIEGCSTPTCFVLTNVSIYMAIEGNTNPDIIHYVPDGGTTRNWVTYQGGTCGQSVGVTPTRTTTWGAIKSLYR